MSDSKDLDKYGEWVENSPKDIKGEPVDAPENAIDDIDLPSDDDMFNDIDFPMTAEDLNAPATSGETEISDLDIDIDIPATDDASAAEDENKDTTLSPDELSNITGDMEGGEDENADTTLSPDELMNITGGMEGAEDENADTTLSPDELMNITESQDVAAEEAGMDDFNIDGLDISADETPAEPAAPAEPSETATEEVSLDDMPDGEIDLDDFMSDSSSGASSGDSTPDGDVDLSAFMDGDDGEVDLGAFMDDAPSSKKEAKPEEIQDEKSLDIDVSFDDSAAEIAQEDVAEESAPEPAAEIPATEGADDMFDTFEKEHAPKAAAPQASNGDTEEIDLSDFGFDDDDSNIGMTNGPDGAAAQKKEVVDYDMKVSADDDSKTPSVQDVVMGNVESSDETEIDEREAAGVESGAPSASEQNLEINEKGKEILSQIMGELSSLKDEIKNLKNDFAELKDRPTVAAGTAPVPAAEPKLEKEENTGFFGADDDGDDTIALSGNELTNILSNAEFSTEEPAVEEEPAIEEEPAVEETPEEEFAETSVGEDDITMSFNESDMEEPTIDTTEITPEDLAGTTDEFGDENVLPEEISVPKSGDDITVESSSSDLMDSVVNTDELQATMREDSIDTETVEEILNEDEEISDSLDQEKIEYMEKEVGEDESIVSVDDIVKENVSLQSDDDGVAVGVGDNIDAAFEEADAFETNIEDTALAEKEAYENNVSDIMKENISLQEDADDVSISVGDDIHEAFKEADATESDIVDDALAEKDAYENSKSFDEDFNLDDTDNEEPVPETLDETILAEQTPAAESSDDVVDMSIFDDNSETSVEEPVVEETAVEEPTVEEPAAEEPALAETPASAVFETSASEAAVADTSAQKATSISKDLKNEIVSVLSYMDQLLENLPEDKITEFAKSEHFVTYKKLFDELGLS